MSEYPLFLIVVFDGLRPDMVTPESMPCLNRFVSDGTYFSNARTVFPSSTRPSAAALATGSTPRRNGIVHNKYFDPNIFSDHMFRPNLVSDIEAGMATYNGELLSTPSLGDLASEADYSMATLLSGSAGTSRLINPRAKEQGNINLGFRGWTDSCPASIADELIERHGPIPASTRPDTDAIRVQTDMLIESIYARHQPDIMVTWFSEPDQTHHYHGVGSTQMADAIGHVDAQFGRIVDWSQQPEFKDRLQIIAISDHGHLTTSRRIDVNAEAAKVGFHIGDHFEDGADYAGYTSYCGALKVRDGDRGRITAMVEWLFEQPWCGIVCTPGDDEGNGIEGIVPGTFDHALVLMDHPRTPEIVFVMRNDDAVHGDGVVGSCFYNGSYPEGGGTHGGLHPKEMQMFMAARGTMFRDQHVSDHPAGIIDIAPTILDLLKLRRPDTMDGRVLLESLTGSVAEPPAAIHHDRSVERNGRVQHLKFSRVASTTYLDAGWVQ